MPEPHATPVPPTRLLYITAVPVTQYYLLRGQNDFLAERGYELHAAASPGEYLQKLAERDPVTVHPVAIAREISPLQDLRALAELTRLIRRVRPHILHLSTPKAALLGALAGWVCRVPVRIFLLRGLLSSGRDGWGGKLYHLTELLTARLCHQQICVSPSLLDYARAARIIPAGSGCVAAKGMSNGIDPAAFATAGEPPQALRDFLAPARAAGGAVIGFSGRLTRDKGLQELADAWLTLRREFPEARLLICGSPEEGDPVEAGILARLVADPRVHFSGWIEKQHLGHYYESIDLYAFPSYREGFPNGPMEAAVFGKPVVTTDAIGCRDAVEDGVTGRLVPARDADALTGALRAYLSDPALRRQHGEAGRARVLRDFAPPRIWQGLHEEYQRQLAAAAGRRASAAQRAQTHKARLHRLYPPAKRLFDLAVALLLLIPAAPVILLVAALLRWKIGSPVLFAQERPGLGGKTFTLVKFRTMRNANGPDGQPLPDAERLTPAGNLVRRLSLDELPQLWNVLRGEMSLVGPRPLLPQYLPLYSPRQARRHEVRPGITGWAQVNGRNAISWDERFDLDVWYVEHCSFLLDLKILLLTLRAVFRREGISNAGHATMPFFEGTPREPDASAGDGERSGQPS